MISWVGDGPPHSQVPTKGLGEAAQAHHRSDFDASGGPAGRGVSGLERLASSTTVASILLDGSAELLADVASGSIALQAAAAACIRSELYTPTDLALAGSGEEFPPEVQDIILEGCSVTGAREALELLFKVSREGLEGTLALESRRCALGGRSPVQHTPLLTEASRNLEL